MKIISFIFALFIFSHTLIGSEKEINQIIVCKDSVEMLEWDLEFISQAKHSIEFSSCFTGGIVLQRVLDALEAQLNKVIGLKVFVLACPFFLDKADQERLDQLKEKYKERFSLQFTTPVLAIFPDSTAMDNHIKCIIVDETYFSSGGTNFDEFLCTDGSFTPPRRPPGHTPLRDTFPAGTRDQDIVGRGPLAKELRILFHKMFALWEYHLNQGHPFESNLEAFCHNATYFPIDEKTRAYVAKFEKNGLSLSIPEVEMLVSGPGMDVNPITEKYVSLINNAKEEIIIGNPYCNPVAPIREALQNAAKRGVAIKFITNGIRETSPSYTKYFTWATRINFVPIFYGREFSSLEYSTFQGLPSPKSKAYEYAIPDVVYHKKVMAVDRKVACVGCYNFSARSHKSDYENLFVMYSEKAADELVKVLEFDMTNSFEVTTQEMRDWYFDPVTYYLGSVQRQFYGFI